MLDAGFGDVWDAHSPGDSGGTRWVAVALPALPGQARPCVNDLAAADRSSPSAFLSH